MGKIRKLGRRRLVAVAVGGGLLLGGGTAAAAVVVAPGSPDVEPAAVTVSPAPESPIAATSVADTAAPTVADVTEPAQPTVSAPQPPAATPAPEPSDESYDPTAPYVDPNNGFTYAPAPQVPANPLPGEGDGTNG